MKRSVGWLAIGCLVVVGAGRVEAQTGPAFTLSFTPATAGGQVSDTDILNAFHITQTGANGFGESQFMNATLGSTLSFDYTFSATVAHPQVGAAAGAFLAFQVEQNDPGADNAPTIVPFAMTPAGQGSFNTSGHFSFTFPDNPTFIHRNVPFQIGIIGSEQLPDTPGSPDVNTSATLSVTNLTVTPAGAGPSGVPEIDPGSMVGALTLFTGGVLVLTDRRRRVRHAPA